MNGTYDSKAKKTEVIRAILVALHQIKGWEHAREGSRDGSRWIDFGERICVGIHLESPTHGTPRWRLQIERFGGQWFHEKKGTGFDYPGIAQACIDLVARRRAERTEEDRRAALQDQANEMALKHGVAIPLSVREEGGRIVLSMRARPVTEEQVEAMTKAARACGLILPDAEE
jgi:hypothetical protein